LVLVPTVTRRANRIKAIKQNPRRIDGKFPVSRNARVPDATGTRAARTVIR
jgi:hypothetical protein